MKHSSTLTGRMKSILLVIFLSLGVFYTAQSQVTVTYNTNGSFTVPAGVSKLTVEAWGGGAGGSTIGAATNGGGGGAYARNVLTVTPGSTHSITIGSGGGPGVNGGVTIFSASALAVAFGGNSSGVGGSASGTGSTQYGGGNGALPATNRGGGGGSSAGSAAPGNNGSGITGGVAPANGGNGGNAQDSDDGSGGNGSAPGGGGAGKSGTGTAGNGANGRIVITYPSFVAASLDCVCNNDQTPNQTDGTFTTVLIIKASDDSPLISGSAFTIISSTGLNNIYGGPIANQTFTFCPGGNCPTGVSAGQYYMYAKVQSSGTYSATIDGPDANVTADITLASTNCNVSYPALPVFPTGLTDEICLSGTLNMSGVSNSIYALDNSQFAPQLPDGFSQSGQSVDGSGNTSGTTVLTITPPVIEADNDPFFELHLISQINGCKTSSYKEFNVYNPVNPDLESITLNCLDPKKDTVFFLAYLIGDNNTGGGEFYVDGNLIDEGKYHLGIDPNNPLPVCKEASYTIIDSCGNSHTESASFLVTFGPKPAFDFAAGSPKSPQCTIDALDLTLNRTSNGANASFFAYDDGGNTIPVTYPTVSLPSPSPGEVIKYTICLTESNDAPAACAGTPDPEECRDTICREFILYQDNSECGALNPFASTYQLHG